MAFELQGAAKVKYQAIAVDYQGDSTSIVSPFETAIQTQRLYQQLPVQGLVAVKQQKLSMPSGSLPASPTPAQKSAFSYAVHNKVNSRRAAACRRGICDEVYFALLRFPEFAGPAPISLGSDMVTSVTVDAPRGDEHAAHEWGHAFGVGHTANDPCGADSDPAFPPLLDPWPFILDTRDGPRPIISALSPANDAAWGFDRELYGRLGARRYTVRRPETSHDLMSYCSPNWTSTTFYKRMKDNILLTLQNPPGPGSTLPFGRATREYFEVRGTIEDDDSITLAPTHTSHFPDGAETYHYGNYTVRTRNGAGSVIDEVEFSPDPGPQDAGVGFLAPKTFSVAVPFSDAIRSIEIVDPNGITSTYPRSTRLPVVTPLSPTAGAVLSGEQVLEWDAADLDGDTLTYMVEYSADNMETLTLLDVDVADTLFSVDVSALPSSTEAFFRITASDGVGSRSAWIGPVTIEPSAPTITALAPQQMLRGRQPVALEAIAYDSDDGRLVGDAIFWESDLDGPFAVGENPSLLAGDFSVGVHTLTAIATTSNGLSNSAQVTLTIGSVSDVGAPAGPDLRLDLSASGDVQTSLPSIVLLTVENAGSDPTGNPILLTSTVPEGVEASNVSGGPNWNCVLAAPEWACTWIGSPLAPGAFADPVVVELIPAADTLNGPGFFVLYDAEVATLGDIFTANDYASTSLAVRTDSFVDLTVDVDRVGVWAPGYTTRLETYVQSLGESDVGGLITVSQTFPAGVSVVSAGGEWWDCSTAGQTVTCTWTGPIVAAGATLPPIVVEAYIDTAGTLFVEVATSVSTAGDESTSNDTQTSRGDVVNFIGVGGDLALHVQPPKKLSRGERTLFRVDVENLGYSSDLGPVTVGISMPPDVTFAFNTGTDWTCSANGTFTTCDWAGGEVGTRRSLPQLFLYLDVGTTAASPTEIVFEKLSPVDNQPDNDVRTVSAIPANIANGDLSIRLTPGAQVLAGGVAETLLVDVKNISQSNSESSVRIRIRSSGEPLAFLEVVDAAGWNCSYKSAGRSLECLWASTIASQDSAPTLTLGLTAGPHAAHAVVEAIVLSGQSFGGSDNDGDLLWLPVHPGVDLPPIAFSAGTTNGTTRIQLNVPGGAPPIDLAIGGNESITTFDISPDGRTIVASVNPQGTVDGELRLYPVGGGAPTILTTGEDDNHPRFTPDGAWIYFERDLPAYSFWRIRPDGSSLEMVIDDVNSRAGAPTNDGTLYYGGRLELAPDNVFLGILRRDPDGTITPVTDAVNNISWLDITPDGQRIVVVATNVGTGTGIWVVPSDPADTTPPRALNALPDQQLHREPRISRDGQWVMTYSHNATSGGAYFVTELDGPRRMFAGRGMHAVMAPRVDAPSGTSTAVSTLIATAVDFDAADGLVSGAGDAVVIRATAPPKGGALDCTETSCTYTPHGRFSGTDLFQFWMSDGSTAFYQSQMEVQVKPTPPKLVVDAPFDGQGVSPVPGSVDVEGSVFVDVVSEAVDVVVVVDLWAVAYGNQNVDCDGDGLLGQPGDDVNHDGVVSALDCHIATLNKLVEELSARPETSIALVFHGLSVGFDHPEHDDFGPNVRLADLSPAAGIQRFVDVAADADDNGVFDIIDVLSSVAGTTTNCNGSIAAGLYTQTEPFDCTFIQQASSIDDAIDTAHGLLSARPSEHRRAVWLFSPSPLNISMIADPLLFNATSFSALASSGTMVAAYVPTAHGCNLPVNSFDAPRDGFLEALARTGGSCFNTLNNPLGVTAALPPIALPDIERIEFVRASDAPISGTRTSLDKFTGVVTGIEAGPNTIAITATTVFDTTLTESVTVYGQDGYNLSPFAVADVVLDVGSDDVTFNVLAIDGDPDGDRLALTTNGAPSSGSVDCQTDGLCRFTPGPSFASPATFEYTITDGAGGFASALVTLTSQVGNRPPVAPPRALAVDLGANASVALLDPEEGAFDPEGGALTFVSAGPASRGTLNCDSGGVCSYLAPNTGPGLIVVPYVVSDSGAQQSTGFIMIEIGARTSPDVALEADAFGTLTVGTQATLPLRVRLVSATSVSNTVVQLFLPTGLTVVSGGPGWTCATVQTTLSCFSDAELSTTAPVVELPLTVAPGPSLNDGARLVAFVEVAGDRNVENDELSRVLTVIGGGINDGGVPHVDGGVVPDAGEADAGEVDAGEVDAGEVDAGEVDAGEADGGVIVTDAGPSDAGGVVPDAGVVDAGTPDGGVVADAGTLDSGTPGPVDAGAVVDAGDGVAPTDCACNASAERQGTRWGIVASLALLLMSRRRRRRDAKARV